jgi:two-component system alkaline phosphatase synthesis response regulator PhoP|tara:strand:+ start:317 stop:721 length:405 start_codon:yes stop_codon:yes gene_type:complete
MTHRILVVDDETHILQVLSLKLRNSGFEVSTAVDGEDALRQALDNPPDLIITDIQMPYMNGIELCSALVENKATTHIPVVVITARGHTLAQSDTDIANVRDVISKPFSPRGVAELATSILSEIPAQNAHRSEAA